MIIWLILIIIVFCNFIKNPPDPDCNCNSNIFEDKVVDTPFTISSVDVKEKATRGSKIICPAEFKGNIVVN